MAADQLTVVNDLNKNKHKYSVSLTLENCILPAEKLFPSPSHIDGLEPETEIELRIFGCELIQSSGILLRLPQVAMATGQVLFQRFYYSKSFIRYPMKVVAMACIQLASKVEEVPRRIRDIVNVFHHIRQVKSGKTIQPLILDQNYVDLKNQIIKTEGMVLKSLGFSVHVKHPHKKPRGYSCFYEGEQFSRAFASILASLHVHSNPYNIIVTLLEILEVKNKKLMQTAWNYMNDSFRTDVFVRYDPETIACACIYLSARLLQIPLPNKPAWYLVFEVSQQDMDIISHIILSLYTRKKPDPEKLEKIVEDLRKVYQEAKLKVKRPSSQNNLISSSPASQPCSQNGTILSAMDSKNQESDHRHNQLRSKYKELNHRKRRNQSSSDDDYQNWKKRTKTSSSGSGSSYSSSPKRNKKMSPRRFKDSRHFRCRSRSKGRMSKDAKHRSSHKRRHSDSLSPTSPIHHSSSKKPYKYKPSKKSYHAMPLSHSHERNRHSLSPDSPVHYSSSKKSYKKHSKPYHSRSRSQSPYERNHRSLSPASPIHRNSGKKSYKNKHSRSSHSRSRSQSPHECNHYKTKSRKDKVKDYHSREKKR